MDRNYLDSIRRLWQNDNPFSNRRHEREWPGFANRQRTSNSSPFLSNSERIYNLLLEYNNNIQHYQENFLYLTSAMIQEMRNENTQRNRRNSRQPAESRMHFEFIPTTDFTTFFQNVTVAPTDTQISNASRVITYNTDEPLNFTSCPITIENFEDGEHVLVLNYCGHAFREEAIRNWFRSNVRCPVCRHDIRTLPTVSSPTTTAPLSPIHTPSYEPTQNPPAPSPTRTTTPGLPGNDERAELSGGLPLSRTNSHTTQSIQTIIEQTINALQTQMPNANTHYITMDIPIQFDASFQEQDDDNQE